MGWKTERLDQAQVVAVECAQFGDSGKGKVVDHLAEQGFRIDARGTGADNAGHTVKTPDGRVGIFHFIPSAINYDAEGMVNILGNGMLINPIGFLAELRALEASGGTYEHLMVSKDAGVITPWAQEHDAQRNQSLAAGGIGSTGKGVGPAYGDKALRLGLFLSDFFDKDHLVKRLEKLRRERYADSSLSVDDVVDRMYEAFLAFKPLVRDTRAFLQEEYRKGTRILLEGAQGILLSVEYGTRPYVTSSDPSAHGLAQGVGLPFDAIDVVLNLVKFPYMTRVGGGPFVTELGGRESEEYCAMPLGNREADERESWPDRDALLRDPTEFELGVALRMRGGEYGATTARPRRTGWTDLAALRYALAINGPDVVLTKADVVEGMGHVALCTDHIWMGGCGVETPYGKLWNGQLVPFMPESHLQRRCVPNLSWFEGWNGPLRELASFDEAEPSLRFAVAFLEQRTGAHVRMLSVGPKRDEMLYR